jgi:hypothetical protein
MALSLVALRVPFWILAREMAARRARYLGLLRVAIAQPNGAVVAEACTADLARLGGTLDVDDDGSLRVAFPDLALGMSAAARLRRARRTQPADADPVVFDTSE